ncbi:sorting and assembly machinery component 50 [Mactra antiquata]
MFRKVKCESQPNSEKNDTRFSTQVKVDRVVINGLDRTKDDIVIKQVEPLFEADTFEEMLQKSGETEDRLKRLGIFKQVATVIDTSKGENASENGYEVNYIVKENRNVSAGAHAEIGTNDGTLRFNVNSPNMFGRAERLTADYRCDNKQMRGFGLHFTKPVNGNTDVLIGANAYQAFNEFPWSGYTEKDRGLGIDLSFPSLIGIHNIKWEGVWRDLRCSSNKTSFAVREQAGHSLKCSIIHSLTRDSRDNAILPTEGTLLKLTQEYAGIGGNAQFFKHQVELQANKSLFLDSVLQLSLAGGVMRHLQANKEIMISDKFFLGGPLTLRGFDLNGAGPCSDGNALGGDMYCVGAVHLYTPLPFRSGKGGLGDILRSHFFVNTGNCGNFQSLRLSDFNKDNLDLFRNSLRLSYGAGIVLRLGGVARVELNYVVPIWLLPGDRVNPGIQLGVGLSFL